MINKTEWQEKEFRFVLCERCGSEGRIYSESRSPGREPVEVDHGPCGACDGTGREPIEVEPITMEDLLDE